ncbi:SDR family oxidoreductase [Microbacterium rhizosphaerae]|uniref:NAD(P)H-binding protein n=1 Tax=Microbacterium rhizosphaerae TaxID=1678237 RepID=A0ABZ0SP24_9MICO|nr:NAD(P)H-binding protein [Microbacterium rhizosphaerae]WPR91106.1 NAD(P)H-binding protein [Microbacterium rhizosphaerae]
MASILVTGGTGNLGRHVVPLLRAQGHGIRVLSRSPRSGEGVDHVVGDTVSGEGLAAAVAGVDRVLHLAGSNKGDDIGTGHLVDAAHAAGVAHLVMISVVGADRMPIGYFRAKDRAERVLAGSGVPFTVLRAAQFHDFVWGMFGGMVKMPLVPAPRAIRLEPVDVGEVAARLAELVDEAPAGRVADLAGPEILDAPTLLRGIAAVRGVRRPFVPMRVPGAVGRAYRAGDNLAGDGVLRGRVTWAEYLEGRKPVPVGVAGR